MLRLLPFLLGALLVFVPGQAQAQATFDFGVRAGFTSSDIDSDFDTQARQGISAGGFATLIMPRVPFDLQLELLFTQKGGDQTVQLAPGDIVGFTADDEPVTVVNSVDINDEFSVSYLEIPLLAKLPLDIAPQVDIHLFAGPALGLRLDEDISFSPGTWQLAVDGTPAGEPSPRPGNQPNQFFNDLDFGGTIGGDVTFNLGLIKPIVDVRYVYGLTTNLSTEFGRPSGLSNRALSVSVGVAL
ncbi:MAG: outer membrane beta-barrel protein [Bacteroidetes bacterium]|jgi:hypothetical protein|nr:outer membrane beta-barrel protein [Bacteroidota bacterium]